MAYKFQVGPASLSGSLKRSGSMDIMDGGGVSKLTIDSSNGDLASLGTVSGTTLSGSTAVRTGGGDAWGFSNAGVAKFAATSINGALTGVTTLSASGLASVASISMDDGSTLGPDSVAGLWTFSAAGDTTQADGAYDFDLASHDGTNGLKLGGVLVNASAADLNFTNVATAGTAEASKALVLDANKDIGTIRNLTINGTFSDSNYTFDTSGNVTGLGTVACGAVTSTAQVLGTTVSGSSAVRSGVDGALYGFDSAGAAKFGATAATSLSASSTLHVVGTTQMSGALQVNHAVINLPLVPTAVFHGADFFVGRDSATGDLQARTVADVTSDLAGIGLSAGTGSLALDLNELSAAAVNVANDSIAIVDADDSNASKKESIADLATAMAGTGVTATNGVFSVDTTGGDSMSAVAIADGGNVAAGLNYLAAITADATVTLPTPAKGDICVIKAHTISAGKELIINRSGTQTIDGLTSISIRSDYGAVTLIATAAGTACDWRIA